MLYEVALLIEEADGDEGQAEIAGRLTMIPRQDPKLTGVNGKAFVQSKLGTKVSHQLGLLGQMFGNLGVWASREVTVVSANDALELGHIGTVFGGPIDPLLG